ncbi:unnamed protein product, partial [Prorocentrum cordatum]
ALFRKFQDRVDCWQSARQAAAPRGPAAGDAGGFVARAGGALSGGLCALCGLDGPVVPAARFGGKAAVPRWARSWPHALWALPGAALVDAAAVGLSLLRRAPLRGPAALEDAGAGGAAEAAGSHGAAA